MERNTVRSFSVYCGLFVHGCIIKKTPVEITGNRYHANKKITLDCVINRTESAIGASYTRTDKITLL